MDRRTFLIKSISATAGLPFAFKLLKKGFPLESNPEFRIWNRLGGPLGGLGYNVRYRSDDPNIFFVTDNWTGLQRSDNGGEEWYPANNGIEFRSGASNDAIPVFAFRIDPNDNDIMWAGMEFGGGLYKSTNGGETWVEKSNGMDLEPDINTVAKLLTMRHIEVEPANSDVVYALGEMHTDKWGDEFERVKGYVYKSIDGGENWTLLNVFDSLTRWMFIDPNDTNRIMIATGIFDREADTDDPSEEYKSGLGLGMFVSTDGGATWSTSNTGIDTSKSLFVGGFDRDPSDPNTMIIATGSNNDFNKGINAAIYRSTDGGDTWVDVTPKDVSYINEIEALSAVAFSPSDPNIVYVGSVFTIMRSDDNGVTWTSNARPDNAPYGPPGVRGGVPIDLVVSPNNPDTLYVNNYGGGVFKSIDGGKNWISWSKGYSGADIHSISVNPSNPNHILANGRSAVFSSQDAGENWAGISYGEAAFAEGMGVVFDPSDEDGNTIFTSDEHESLILRSSDAGQNWEPVLSLNTGDVGDRHGARKIVFAPSNSNVVYAGYMAADLHTNPHKTDFSESLGMYKSTDGGRNWVAVNNGLPNGAQARNITDIAISHQDAGIVYVSLRDGGLYKTENGGQSWVTITGTLTAGQSWNDTWRPDEDNIPRHSLFSVAVHPENDQLVFIGCNVHGLYKSEDGGLTWAQVLTPQTIVENGTSDHGHIMSIVFDPITPSNIYAAEWHGGVYESTDGGESWLLINEALSTRAVAMLQFSGKGEYLYAATQGEGVFRYQLREVDNTKVGIEEKSNLPVSVVLKQNYPNPFNPGTTINYSIKKSGFVKLTIYNSIGQNVATLVNQIKTSGNHSVYFDASKLSSGIYIYTLEANGAKISEEMTVIK